MLFVVPVSGFPLIRVQVVDNHHVDADKRHLQMLPYVGCAPQGPVGQTLSGI